MWGLYVPVYSGGCIYRKYTGRLSCILALKLEYALDVGERADAENLDLLQTYFGNMYCTRSWRLPVQGVKGSVEAVSKGLNIVGPSGCNRCKCCTLFDGMRTPRRNMGKLHADTYGMMLHALLLRNN